MSENINLQEDARFAGVLADLKRIEKELVETDELVALTGTGDSSVVIEFDNYGEGKNAEPSILIKVTSSREYEFDEDLLEDFEDYVLSRLEAASSAWSQEVTDLLGDDRLIVVLINGEEY